MREYIVIGMGRYYYSSVQPTLWGSDGGNALWVGRWNVRSVELKRRRWHILSRSVKHLNWWGGDLGWGVVTRWRRCCSSGGGGGEDHEDAGGDVWSKKEEAGSRFVKSTHISMISNSVTHLRSYTNSAIADIAGNSTPISPVTPHDRRRRRAERRRLCIDRRYRRIEWPPRDRRRRGPKRRRLHIQRRYRRIEWRLFHDVSQC